MQIVYGLVALDAAVRVGGYWVAHAQGLYTTVAFLSWDLMHCSQVCYLWTTVTQV